MTLKYRFRKLRNSSHNLTWKIQYWILQKMNSDVIEDFCIDTELLDDYYNEPYD